MMLLTLIGWGDRLGVIRRVNGCLILCVFVFYAIAVLHIIVFLLKMGRAPHLDGAHHVRDVCKCAIMQVEIQ